MCCKGRLGCEVVSQVGMADSWVAIYSCLNCSGVMNRDGADASAPGRIVSLMEGGYDLQGLSRSVAAHVATLMRG